MDFTITSYKNLLNALQSQGFSFHTFSGSLSLPNQQSVKQLTDILEPEKQNNKQQTTNNTCPERSRREQQARNNEQRTPNKLIILRHDVDLLPRNSLAFAKIQNQTGIKGTYYFRTVNESWDEHIIREISELGHEVGYHYENMDTCKGDVDLAGTISAATWNS